MADEHFFSNTHILLVEDDRSHREFVANILEGIGCKVMIAFNGKDALSLIERNNKFDIILMDIEMPEMDGLEASRRIREMKRHGDMPDDTPIVAITSNSTEDIEKTCLDAGMAGMIPKHLWKPKWEPSIKEKLQEFIPKNKER